MTNEKLITPWLRADWPVPDNVHAGTSTRMGGHSSSPYNELNLADHVGDDKDNVKKNREVIIKQLLLKSPPHWLNQTHSKNIVTLDNQSNNYDADAAITTKPNQPCVVLTADCAPVLFCDTSGKTVAAAHAGWRGICKGVIENTVKQFREPQSLHVWIGPCICKDHYEVGKDVYSGCCTHAKFLDQAFQTKDEQHWLCDLSLMIKLILQNMGINSIYENGLCTYENTDQFYSYRRDGKTGRIATMIWME